MLAKNNTVLVLYKSFAEANAAIKELRQYGFEMKHLWIVGRHASINEDMNGFHIAKNGDKYWKKLRAFWGGIWGLLFGSAIFLIPGLGPFLFAGPFVSWIVWSLEGAVNAGGLSEMGACLHNLGLPKGNIKQFAIALKSGKYVVIAHGAAEEMTRAWEIINHTSPEALEDDRPSCGSPEACAL